ncbi:MAG: DUF350 domain-containing protein [Deltaproteobacteria bacterium]|jgi:uncharacterized membrane protein YjfL (UPF0719 family)|nr:DUF350 domain-containing protein [Deltaproteobacteria bacterium]
METLETVGKQLLITLGYASIGLLAFALTFWLIVKIAPFSLRKEIEEDHNSALAILIGAVIIGVAIIVSAAIHG